MPALRVLAWTGCVLEVYEDAISESTSWGAYEALSTSLEMPSGTVVYLLADIVFTPLHIISVAGDAVVRFLKI